MMFMEELHILLLTNLRPTWLMLYICQNPADTSSEYNKRLCKPFFQSFVGLPKDTFQIHTYTNNLHHSEHVVLCTVVLPFKPLKYTFAAFPNLSISTRIRDIV